MFVKPKYTRDPKKQKLERVYHDPFPTSSVPVGTYIVTNNQIGNPEKEEKYRLKLKNKMGSNYNMLRIEDKNRQWINTARKDYIAKVEEQKGQESINQFMKASGFDESIY
jgi:hypothetical protein